MHLDLSNQVGIVTGGGRGIGRAVAQELAQAGMAMAVCARSAHELEETVNHIQAAGGKALAMPLDVTDRQAIAQMVAATEAHFGPVDLLVNNAGVVQPLGPIWEVDVVEWWRAQEVNLLGSFLCAQAVLPGMVARRRGRILNVASRAGLRSVAYGSAYAIAKTALIRFTEILAAETRGHNISVFALEPGTTQTAMTDYLHDSQTANQWLPWFRDNFDAGRGVVPMADVIDVVRFLVSGRADPLSGCCIGVSDDLEALVQHAEQIEQEQLYTLRMRKLEL